MATKDISDKAVCLAYKNVKEGEWKSLTEALQKITGQPEKVCYRAMDRAEKRGYMESGLLTNKGKELINDSKISIDTYNKIVKGLVTRTL